MSETSNDTEAVDDVNEGVSVTPWWKSSRATTIAALVIAVVAAGIAIADWFRPGHDGGAKPSFNDQETSQAKATVCSAYATVHRGVVTNTHMDNPDPQSQIGQLAVAANARLALVGGGAYLQDRVAALPATPADLAQAIKAMGSTIEQLGSAYLEDANDIVLDPLRHDFDSEVAQLNKLCG